MVRIFSSPSFRRASRNSPLPMLFEHKQNHCCYDKTEYHHSFRNSYKDNNSTAQFRLLSEGPCTGSADPGLGPRSCNGSKSDCKCCSKRYQYLFHTITSSSNFSRAKPPSMQRKTKNSY